MGVSNNSFDSSRIWRAFMESAQLVKKGVQKKHPFLTVEPFHKLPSIYQKLGIVTKKDLITENLSVMYACVGRPCGRIGNPMGLHRWKRYPSSTPHSVSQIHLHTILPECVAIAWYYKKL